VPIPNANVRKNDDPSCARAVHQRSQRHRRRSSAEQAGAENRTLARPCSPPFLCHDGATCRSPWFSRQEHHCGARTTRAFLEEAADRLAGRVKSSTSTGGAIARKPSCSSLPVMLGFSLRSASFESGIACSLRKANQFPSRRTVLMAFKGLSGCAETPRAGSRPADWCRFCQQNARVALQALFS